jgi:hypothetical protein
MNVPILGHSHAGEDASASRPSPFRGPFGDDEPRTSYRRPLAKTGRGGTPGGTLAMASCRQTSAMCPRSFGMPREVSIASTEVQSREREVVHGRALV